jgi:4-amino-4-deoxy-L-arabinose transferase-like glycosyltransferase
LPALLSPKALDDEQVYAVVAREMLHGGRPYLDAVERKPPLLFLLYEQVLRLGDHDWFALHLFAVLWTLATMAALYLIARRLFDRTTGYWAAFLYALFVAWADYRSLALNGELLMNLPAMAAVAIAFGRGSSRWRPELLLSGALVALAFLLKQPSGIVAPVLGLFLLLPAYRQERQISGGFALLHAAPLTIGFTVVFAITGLWLWHDGILYQAVYWTVLDHGVPRGPTTWPFWRGALLRGGFFALSALPLILGTAESVLPGLRARRIWRGLTAEYLGLLMLLVGSLIGVAAGGQFLYHYFLQLIPPLCLLAAPIFTEVWRQELRPHLALPPRPVLGTWLALLTALFLTVDVLGVATHDKPGEAAIYVRDHSATTDRIFVWGQGDRFTGYYLDAERRPATRYIATYPLTGHIFGVWDPAVNTTPRILAGAWDSLRVDFERHPPRYIINTDGIFQPPAYPISSYTFLSRYMAQYYREVYRARDGVVYERVPGDSKRS